MADTPPVGRWAVRHVPPPARSITKLIQAGTLDAELAATLWVLIEGRVPVIVAASATGTGKSTLQDALLDFVPPDVRKIELAGAAETFDWLPQAAELGWQRTPDRAARRGDGGPVLADAATGPGPAVRPETAMLVVPEFSDHLPSYTWGEEARIAIRAATIGYGLMGTLHADSLEDVLEVLGRPPVALTDDETSRLGVALILRRRASDGARRVVAAHYVRPVARDEHGHVQRLGPAVLATWDTASDRFEHFGWGITPELARRVGRRSGDFELEVDRRRDVLETLVEAGVVDVDAVRLAIDCARTPADPATVSH